mgnify:FL=1|tara:strand:- start:374 stop:973 length:600 start_codon:yes stop_codon:yes gene_type:complete
MQIVGAVVIGYVLAQFLDFQFFTESGPSESTPTKPAVPDEDQFDEDHPEYILTPVFTANGETVWRYQISMGLVYDDGAIDERTYESFFIIGNEDGTSFRTEVGDRGITVPPRTGQRGVSVWPSAEAAIEELTEEEEPAPPWEPQPEPEEDEEPPVLPPIMPPTGFGPSQGSLTTLRQNGAPGGASEGVYSMRGSRLGVL